MVLFEVQKNKTDSRNLKDAKKNKGKLKILAKYAMFHCKKLRFIKEQ